MTTTTRTRKPAPSTTKVVTRPEAIEPAPAAPAHGPALSVACPTCGAEAGRPCSTTGARVRVTAPHAARRTLAEKATEPKTVWEAIVVPCPEFAPAFTPAPTPAAERMAELREACRPTPKERALRLAGRIETEVRAQVAAGSKGYTGGEATKAPGDMTRVERLNAAKPETAALKAWKTAGEEGDRPATPVLDWMTNPQNNIKASPAKEAAVKVGRPAKAEEARVERADFTVVAYNREHPEWTVTAVRHHPDGCTGNAIWAPRPGTPDELARKSYACKRCLARFPEPGTVAEPTTVTEAAPAPAPEAKPAPRARKAKTTPVAERPAPIEMDPAISAILEADDPSAAFTAIVAGILA